jgi:hypothetical protein
MRLNTKYPLMYKIFESLYNLKRNIILLVTFVTFYVILLVKKRSFINWGFMVLTTLLTYIEISQNHSRSKNKKYWQLMIFYSSLIIIINVIFIFINLEYFNEKKL